MKVIWQPAARRDRSEVFDFISMDNPGAAARMDLLFSRAAQRLARFPELGRRGVISGTRELIPHANYRMVYQLGGGAVRILAVMNTSRRWPPVSGEGDA